MMVPASSIATLLSCQQDGADTLIAVSRRRLMVLAAVFSQVAISIVQFGLPALTFALRADRGFGPFAFGVLFAATGVGPALALVVAGRLCDLIGARPVLIGGSALGAGGLVVTGFLHGLWPMTASLLVAGIGAAAVPVAGMTAIISHFPPERRGFLLGLRQMAVPAGGFVASGLLPLLHALGGIPAAFVIPGLLQLATGVLFAIVVGPVPAGSERPPPLRASFPPALRWVMLTGGLYVAGLGGVLAFSVAAAHDAGLSQTAAVVVFAGLNIGAATARVVWGIVSDGAGGTRRVAVLSGLGLLGALTAILFPLALHLGAVAAVPAAVALAFGTLGFNGVVYTIAGELAGRAAGVAVGATATVVFLVGSLVGPAYGALVERAGYGSMFGVVAAVCLLGSLAARRIGEAPPAPAYTAS
jgi:MFS family permease